MLLILDAVLVLGSLAAAGLVLRRTITQPLRAMAAAARRVAGGDFDAPMPAAAGPREVSELTAEIEAMRERIVHELAQVEAARERLERQALELSRSNADLEQFAYVASHDLQEPLRKISSFCQALQTRYRGPAGRASRPVHRLRRRRREAHADPDQRPARASRAVGRGGRAARSVALSDVLAGATAALSGAIEETGARIEADGLPTVTGDESLLRSLFQNLLANSLRFRGAESPLVRISARPAGRRRGRSCSATTGSASRASTPSACS